LSKEGNKSQKSFNGRGMRSKVADAVANKLPGYYFPLVIGIILVEAVVLVLVLLKYPADSSV
jgi:hypothetical protein